MIWRRAHAHMRIDIGAASESIRDFATRERLADRAERSDRLVSASASPMTVACKALSDGATSAPLRVTNANAPAQYAEFLRDVEASEKSSRDNSSSARSRRIELVARRRKRIDPRHAVAYFTNLATGRRASHQKNAA